MRRVKRSMRQHRLAGEKLFIDFAGSTVPLGDDGRAHVFRSGHGRVELRFTCATPTQHLKD